MENISPELDEFLSGSFKLRKTLEQVLPKEVVDYLLELIAKDNVHRKLIKITEETENEESQEDASKQSYQPVD